ncbi:MULTISPECIES: hypothetical protein [unclassified Acinetobacter]|uniref:hypothetical protein n=1 Tax=unclassified Acinetobacter TaxID=196816 RepID=UPI0035B71FB2
MHVSTSNDFKHKFPNYPKADKEKILAFINHVKQHCLDGLQGRNKASDNVPFDHPNWSERVAFAQKYHLWHYHIGIPNYTTASNGEQVSQYILHYMRLENEIRIIALSDHPPFALPTEKELV